MKRVYLLVSEIRRRLPNKKGIVSEALPWIIIAIAIMVILMFGIFIFRQKGVTVIDGVKDLFKGR
ncbi:MAG: hypothetical protein PF542_04950 [Nanoarchaeota archaeon]|jgi:hypothetical protein|nr:hypothetical protein [Nanoarchaeota archaeon]